MLPDSKADILLFGNAERALVALTHRLDAGEPIAESDPRPARHRLHGPPGWRPGTNGTSSTRARSTSPGRIDAHPRPYAMGDGRRAQARRRRRPAGDRTGRRQSHARCADRARTVIRLPSYEEVKDDPVLYAHASRVFHLESNPGNARALVQCHGEGPGARDVWINPPPVPLTTPGRWTSSFDRPVRACAAPEPTAARASRPGR